MKQHAPATARNGAAIEAVLAEELPGEGLVLEIASGTGEHAVRYARRFPHLTWQPSDASAEALQSIAAWRAEAGLANLAQPQLLDAAAPDWPLQQADALFCCNMVHISPVAASEGLLRAAGRLLAPGAPLILYGPWLEDGVETAPSNLAFDASLQSRNPEWGLRRREWFDALAAGQGLRLTRREAMPANNLTLVYRRG